MYKGYTFPSLEYEIRAQCEVLFDGAACLPKACFKQGELPRSIPTNGGIEGLPI